MLTRSAHDKFLGRPVQANPDLRHGTLVSATSGKEPHVVIPVRCRLEDQLMSGNCRRSIISKLAVGPMDNNAYLLRCRATGRQLLIDAAADADALLGLVGRDGLAAVVTTHGHADHWQALEQVVADTAAVAYAHPADAPLIPLPTEPLADRQLLGFGSVLVRVIRVRGHTEGSWCWFTTTRRVMPTYSLATALFPGGVGATFGDASAFARLIDEWSTIFEVYTDEAWVYPGHGDDTILGANARRWLSGELAAGRTADLPAPARPAAARSALQCQPQRVNSASHHLPRLGHLPQLLLQLARSRRGSARPPRMQVLRRLMHLLAQFLDQVGQIGSQPAPPSRRPRIGRMPPSFGCRICRAGHVRADPSSSAVSASSLAIRSVMSPIFFRSGIGSTPCAGVVGDLSWLAAGWSRRWRSASSR